MVGVIIFFLDGILLGVLELIELVSFVGSFDGTGDDVGGPCVGLGVGGIMTNYEIDAIQFNDSSPVFCKEGMY